MADLAQTIAVHPGIRYTLFATAPEGSTNTRAKLEGALKFNNAADVRFLKITDTPDAVKSAVKAIALPAGVSRWVVCATFSKATDLPKSPDGTFTIDRILAMDRAESLGSKALPYAFAAALLYGGWRWYRFTQRGEK